MPTNIPEPLHVFRISDGVRLASAGGYFGAGNAHAFDWSPIASLIEFLDAYPDWYLWNPVSGDPPRKECEFVRTTTAALLSTDGKLLSQGFRDGVNLYEVRDSR
jgi:hypothetical protein